MKKSFSKYILLALTITSLVLSCNKDDEPALTGIVKGIVTDSNTSDPLSGVRIIIFDANTNQATENIMITDIDGNYSFSVPGGSYFLKLTKQNYNDVPVKGISALPFTITNGSELDNPVQMFPNGATNLGWISGKLTSSDVPVVGSLVVATNGTSGYSTISDSEGNYVIYNIPAANYNVKAWKAGVNSPQASATVIPDTETSEVNLAISSASGSTVSGFVTFLAISNKDVDVALTHSVTAEAIPGLSTTTSSGNYSLQNVPNGEFLARASYSNDGIVLDPDWIVKNGEPYVTVSGGSATRDFSVTGTVSLGSPNNDASSTNPVPTSSTPIFTWEAYPSSSDYVIEVTDANGNIIWGGFNADWTVKNIIIPSSENSILFNSDGNATESLIIGKHYRWRIYASKDNVQSATGWELISVSEDQRGLIIIE